MGDCLESAWPLSCFAKNAAYPWPQLPIWQQERLQLAWALDEWGTLLMGNYSGEPPMSNGVWSFHMVGLNAGIRLNFMKPDWKALRSLPSVHDHEPMDNATRNDILDLHQRLWRRQIFRRIFP